MAKENVAQKKPLSMAFNVRRSSQTHRAGVIFDEIARLASIVDRVSIIRQEMTDAEEVADAEALDGAIHALTCQIGLLADQGAQCAGGNGWHGADSAAAWLLPPSYHELEQAAPPHAC